MPLGYGIKQEKEMTIDLTKPVQTRDGRKARILCTDMVNPHYPVAAVVTFADGIEVARMYTRDGYFGRFVDSLSANDLVNVPPEPQVEWRKHDRESACDLYKELGDFEVEDKRGRRMFVCGVTNIGFRVYGANYLEISFGCAYDDLVMADTREPVAVREVR